MSLLALLTGAALSAGCSDDPVDGPLPRLRSTTSRPDDVRTPAPGRALVRIVLAAGDAPDAPTARVWASRSGASLGTNMMYGQTSDYVSLEAGAHELVFDAAGVRAMAKLDVRAGTRVTAIAIGRMTPTDPAGALHLLTMEERFEAATGSKATVRVVHASPDAAPFALDVGDDDAQLPELDTVERDGASHEAGFHVAAGAQLQLAMVSRGVRTTAFTAPRLEAGGEYFVVAVGQRALRASDPRGLSLLTVGPRGTVALTKQNPVVRLFHGSPDAPPVAIFAGQHRVADTLSFGDLGSAVQVPPADYDLDLFTKTGTAERPQAKPIATVRTGSLHAGETYLSVLGGYASPVRREPGLTVATFGEDFAASESDAARVRFVNATPDVPALDFAVVHKARIDYVVCGALGFSSASESGGLRLEPQSLTLGISPQGQSGAKPEAAFETRVEAASRGFLVAAGALDPSRGKSLRLFRIDVGVDTWRADALPEIQTN